MKNRIDICFEQLKAQGKKALVTFVTAGDPDLTLTEELVPEMFAHGSDIVEIGVPFSDPIAEGGTIQRASLRSLKNNTNLDQIFDIRKHFMPMVPKQLPLVFKNNVFPAADLVEVMNH